MQIERQSYANVKADYEAKITALRDVIASRLDAMDKANIVLAENVNRVPTLLDREAGRIIEMLKRSEELAGEKFAGLGRQIQERDVRTEQDKRTGETAIAAAFQAQKEAAGKSEILTTKLIDSLQAVITQSQRTMDDKIAVINARLDRGAGDVAGAREQRSDAHMNVGTALSVLALIVSIIVGAAALMRGQSSPAPTVVAPAVVPVAPR